MTLLDFIQRLLGLQTPSADTAKQRLQLVLAHDRSDLNPELLEQMRREILEVVQRYVEIDLDAGDVNLATEDQVTALVANLPIKRALPRPQPTAADPSPAPPTGGSGDLLSSEATEGDSSCSDDDTVIAPLQG
jgi:cell division topological specificity factor